MAGVVAVLSTILGVLATLFMLVMLMASGANASPAHITQIKWMMLGVTLVGALGLAGGVWALVAGRPWLGAAAGAIPVLADIVLVTVLVKLEW